MDTAIIGAGIFGLAIGLVLGRWSSRGARRRVVWSAAATRTAPDEEIEALIRAGKTIHAIKRHREIHGSDLMQAKLAIEEAQTRLLGGG